MGLLNKLITAVRGGAREVGENIVDANAIRIYQQEIEDAKKNLGRAKRDLTQVMAKEMQTAREIQRLQEEITKYEKHAISALNKGDETLAEEVAQQIASLEQEQAVQATAKSKFTNHIERLKALMKKTEATIREHERELAMVRTTESVQKATKSISDNYGAGASKLLDAKSSLDRIKARQRNLDDRMAAADALEADSGMGSLDEKLKAAGIGDKDNARGDVMARLRQKANA